MEKPEDISEEDTKLMLKMKMWYFKVDGYNHMLATMKKNKKCLFPHGRSINVFSLYL